MAPTRIPYDRSLSTLHVTLRTPFRTVIYHLCLAFHFSYSLRDSTYSYLDSRPSSVPHISRIPAISVSILDISVIKKGHFYLFATRSISTSCRITTHQDVKATTCFTVGFHDEFDLTKFSQASLFSKQEVSKSSPFASLHDRSSHEFAYQAFTVLLERLFRPK